MTPEPEDEPPPRRTGFRFNPEINITGALTVLTLIASIIVWAVTASTHTDQLGMVQTSMANQMTDLKAALGAGLADVRQQVSTLPDQRAKLDNDERRLTDLETRFNVLNDRMTAAERTEIELRATLDSFMRSTGNGGAIGKH